MYRFTTYFDTLQSNMMQYCSKLNIQYAASGSCTRTLTLELEKNFTYGGHQLRYKIHFNKSLKWFAIGYSDNTVEKVHI